MILEYLDALNKKVIILGSASPRRKEALERLGLKVLIVPSQFEENLDKSLFSPEEYVKETALQKAKDVQRIHPEAHLIIGCDSIVVLGDKILEKPSTSDHAVSMLQSLSGSTHFVLSGMALIFPQSEGTVIHTFVAKTEVHFDNLSFATFQAYVATGSPMDKAGSYGIQDGIGGSFVKGIIGCYWNVTGFPVHRFCVELKKMIENGLI